MKPEWVTYTGEKMRIGQHGYEIELHPRRENWLWVVFDEDGDEARSGHAPDQAEALSQARRAVAGLRNPFANWLKQALSLPVRHT